MRHVFIWLIICSICSRSAFSQLERFKSCSGDDIEIWRITDDPTMRDWANYHNTDAWSPGGRYICYVRYDPYETVFNSEVRIYDLHADKEIRIDSGDHPRWANNHNWLFYVRIPAEDALQNGENSEVMWLDIDNKKSKCIARNITYLGETDHKDRWLYGRRRLNGGEWKNYRIPICEDSRIEQIETVDGIFWIPNPAHPIIMVRKDHGDPNATDLAFESTRTFCDLDGSNVTIASPMLQRCHQSWSGDGTYLLHGGTGGTLMAGRFWNEPFPSNLHVLTSICCGDISPCGRSGRWVSGSSNQDPLVIADLRSGDGYSYLKSAHSFIHDSDKFSYNKGSALSDNDAKGSPDGTKIVFSSNYDLKNGPMTYISEDAAGTAVTLIRVQSTQGFPEKGRLSVNNEIISYDRKTATTFEGLRRGLYNTIASDLEYLSPAILLEYEERQSDEEFINKRGLSVIENIRLLYSRKLPDLEEGTLVSSFDFRCIPKDNRPELSRTSEFAQNDFPDKEGLNTPLPWQNRTDVYVAVVRLPDPPCIREIDGGVELIPGENSWETAGYHLYKNGKKVTKKAIKPGETLTIQSGCYTAAAVEWSGLESKTSFPVAIRQSSRMFVRSDCPADFSWTDDRWLIKGKEVSMEEAKDSENAVREIVHLVEKTIHREWYNWGQITKRHDLNADGKAVRRLFYMNRKLARREYHTRDGFNVSTEFFDEDGYITESVQYQLNNGVSEERSHFWYEKGVPVKHVGIGGRHGSPLGKGIYVKNGNRWVKKKALENSTHSSVFKSEFRKHEELINSGSYEYAIDLKGTVDMDNTTTRGYSSYDVAFQPNISLEIENVSTTPVRDPWIVINDSRDWRTVDKIVAEATRGYLDEQDKLMLLYEFIQRNKYHDRPLYEEDELHDPVKYFNSYGAGLCDDTGAITCALAYRAGFTRERHGGDPMLRSMHGHVMSEITVNGHYQFIDTDENAFYLDPENNVPVGGDDLVRDHDLAVRDYNKGPLFDSWTAGEKASALFGRDDEKGRSINVGHEMHLVLKPGEKLTLRWDNIGKTPGLNPLKYYGNSFLTYEPEMNSIFIENAYQYKAMFPIGGAITGMSSDAFIIMRVQSPYVICGGTVDAGFDCGEANDHPSVAISLDGERWTNLWYRTGKGHFTCNASIDEFLTIDKEFAPYSYFVRIGLASESQSTKLTSVNICTVLLTAPVALPRLSLGVNRVHYTDKNQGTRQIKVTHTFQESVNIEPPRQPMLLYPLDGKILNDSWIKFKWNELPEAEKYHVRVSRWPDLRTSYRPCFDLVIDSTAFSNQRTGLFNPGETYYWSVRARNKEGVWGKWSPIQNFSWDGPCPPVDLRTTTKDAKIYLSWKPNPKGNKPLRYEVYASDMKGFKPSNIPYDVISIGAVSQNLVTVIQNTELLIVSSDPDDRASNKSSYRVIALDENNTTSGSSWPLELDHPLIYSQPPLQAKVSQTYHYTVKTLQSMGDLQYRYVEPGAAFWEKEGYDFSLVHAPNWIQIDSRTGIVTGTPSKRDAGKSQITIKVKRTWPHELTKTVMYQGAEKKETRSFLKSRLEFKASDEQSYILNIMH